MLKKCWGIVIIVLTFLILPMKTSANTIINGNEFSTFKRTKAEIQAAWNVGRLDSSGNIFEVEPSYTAPYRAGVVKQSYLDDILDNINYYRYLVGVPEITTKISNREDLQTAEVVQYLNLTDRENGVGLTHYLNEYPKPSDMSQEFYNKAVSANHNIITSYGYGSPIFPFFAESVFTYTAGHRDAILSPLVYSLQVGTGKVTYGDSEMRSERDENLANGMTTDFGAYPSPGYFPSQDYTDAADWEIYLNPELYSNIKEYASQITATVENLQTGKIETYSKALGNLATGSDLAGTIFNGDTGTSTHYTISDHIYLKNPAKEFDYYTGDYKVTIKNVRKKSGEIVDLVYTVNFFDKYEGVSSNISSIDFEINSLQWEGEYDEDLIRQFLPTSSTAFLESGGFVKLDIKDYTITDNDRYYYSFHNYDALPQYGLIPTYIKDANKYLNRPFRIDVVEEENEKELKISSNKDEYELGDTVILTADVTSYSNRYDIKWYRLIDGKFELLTTNDEYTVSGNQLTIKNVTLNNRMNYYAVATPGNTLVNFSTIVSDDFDIPLNLGGKIVYAVHSDSKGWSDFVADATTAGTTGQALKNTGFKVMIGNTGLDGDVEYRAYVQGIGWESTWHKNGEIAGLVNEGKRVEAIQVRLTGEMAKHYDIYYRVYSQRLGWLDWAKNGASAGTNGYGYRSEAISIMLVEKGKKAPGSTENPYDVKDSTTVSYQTHVQQNGWLDPVTNGQTSGTTGSGLRMETLRVFLENQKYSGNVEYQTHIQRQGWETTWKKNGENSGTTGQGLRLEAIKVRLTGEMAKYYDIYYRVHVQKAGWLGWAKNGECAGTSGLGLRVEAIQIVLVKKGAVAPGDTTMPYVTEYTTKIGYASQVAQKGWLTKVYDGATSGTTGQGLKLEAIKIQLENQAFAGNIEYRAHLQQKGWETNYSTSGEIAGSETDGLRLEAIQIKLTGMISEVYDVYYRVHVQQKGWLSWAKNGASVGTAGYGLRIEAIEIKLIRKNEPAPGDTKIPYLVNK